MFRRIFLVGMLIFAMLVSGCNSKETNNPPKSSEVVAEHVKGTFDFDTVLANTTINNRKISSLSNFEDLGKDFTLGNCIWDFSKDTEYVRDSKAYQLFFLGEKIGLIELAPDNQIFRINIEDYFPNNKINVCGINFGSTAKEVMDILGTPSHTTKNGSMSFGKTEESYMNFLYLNNNLYEIQINIVGDTSNKENDL
jgi:hypothetical protein